jgi:cyclic-di-GMP-binding protein
MAKDMSFDVVSDFDMQELANALDQARRELNARFDLKDSGSKIEQNSIKSITITTTDDFRLKNILDILYAKFSKRNLSSRLLDPQKLEHALGGNVRQEFLFKKGISPDLSRKIVADIKSSKIKVQTTIQGDQVRVSGKDKDELQSIIRMLREKEEEYDTALQFTNYR